MTTKTAQEEEKKEEQRLQSTNEVASVPDGIEEPPRDKAVLSPPRRKSSTDDPLPLLTPPPPRRKSSTDDPLPLLTPPSRRGYSNKKSFRGIERDGEMKAAHSPGNDMLTCSSRASDTARVAGGDFDENSNTRTESREIAYDQEANVMKTAARETEAATGPHLYRQWHHHSIRSIEDREKSPALLRRNSSLDDPLPSLVPPSRPSYRKYNSTKKTSPTKKIQDTETPAHTATEDTVASPYESSSSRTTTTRGTEESNEGDDGQSAVPAETETPVEEKYVDEEKGVGLSEAVMPVDNLEVLVDDGGADLGNSSADKPSPPCANSKKKLWKRPYFLAIVAVLLVAIIVGAIVGILLGGSSSDSSSSPPPPTLPPPTSSPPPAGLLPDGTWLQLGEDVYGDAADDWFGTSVSLSNDGSVLVAGAPGNNANAGLVRAFRRDSAGSAWSQIGQELKGGVENDYFGTSVSLNGAGNVMAVGADEFDNGAPGYAQAFEYDASSDEWRPLGQQLDGFAADDYFGYSVSLSNDGFTLAVGAYRGRNFRGYVRIFRYDSSSERWSQLGNDIEGQTAGDWFGWAVSLNGAGDVVGVGAREADTPNGLDSGRVQVFQYLSSTQAWIELGQELYGSSSDDDFGTSVSLSNDGMVLAAGAHQLGVDGGAGYVQIFGYESSLEKWSPLGRPLNGEAADDSFGWSVSLNGAGDVVAAGADENSNANGANSGHVRVFQYDMTEVDWIRVGRDIDGESAEDWSGYSVSLSDSGTEVAIGAFGSNVNGVDSGHVRVYTLDPN